MGNHKKIPSVYSYSQASDAEAQQWGASISPNAVSMVHTKLELDVQSTSEELDFILDSLEGMHNLHFHYIRAAGGAHQYPWKGPEEIVEDYLAKVFDSLHTHLVQTAFPEVALPEELLSRMPVDIVVTIPAVCLLSCALLFRITNFMYRSGVTGRRILHFEHLVELGSTAILFQD